MGCGGATDTKKPAETKKETVKQTAPVGTAAQAAKPEDKNLPVVPPKPEVKKEEKKEPPKASVLDKLVEEHAGKKPETAAAPPAKEEVKAQPPKPEEKKVEEVKKEEAKVDTVQKLANMGYAMMKLPDEDDNEPVQTTKNLNIMGADGVIAKVIQPTKVEEAKAGEPQSEKKEGIAGAIPQSVTAAIEEKKPAAKEAIIKEGEKLAGEHLPAGMMGEKQPAKEEGSPAGPAGDFKAPPQDSPIAPLVTAAQAKVAGK